MKAVDYYYKETKAPDNVIMDTEEHKFVLNENNQVVTKEVINEKVSENGSLEITKVTPNGTTLAGVEFDILDEDNNVVDHLVTDANGKATSNHIGYELFQINGKITGFSITEEDIASAYDLSQEIANRIAAIEALDSTKSGATTHVGVKVVETNGIFEVIPE